MPEVGSRDRRPPGESRGRGAQPHPRNRSQVCRGEVFVWPGATRKQPGGAATEEATPPDGHLAATDLVAEVAAGCKYHRDAVFIRRVDHFLVPD